MLDVLAGGDAEDPTAHPTVPDLTADPDRVVGMRIGVPRTWFTERVDAAVLGAHAAAVDAFRELGAHIVPIEFDDLEAVDSECWTVFYGELAANQEANAPTAELFDDGTRARFDVSFTPTAADYLRALRRRPLVQAAMVARMDEAGVDVVLTPGIGATAPRLDDLTMSVDGERFNLHEVVPRNTRLFDYVGFPALMMPAGIAPDGLPVGVQLVGRPWADGTVLSAAVAFQRATAHHLRVPPASASEGRPIRSRTTDEGAARRRAWQVLCASSLSVVLVFISSSALLVALPDVSADLDASALQSSWVLLSYMLTTTTLILVFGRIADLVGRRRLYLAGILVFLAASLACGFAPDAAVLIGARLVQGVGAAAIVTNTTALLTDVFPESILSLGLGVNATVAAVGQVVGPIVGGLVAESLGWRWIFLVGVPVSLAGLLWSVRLVPRTTRPRTGERFDLPGALLSIATVGLLVGAVSIGGSSGWSSPGTIATAASAVLIGWLFVRTQRRVAHPLVDPRSSATARPSRCSRQPGSAPSPATRSCSWRP